MKPISRDKIERQKFKDSLSSKIDSVLSPPVLASAQLSSIEERQLREAQQRIEIQAKAESEAQAISLRTQQIYAKQKEIETRQQEIISHRNQKEKEKTAAATLADQKRRATKAGLLSQLEKDSKADIERLKAMRDKSIAIIDGIAPKSI